MKKGLKKYFSIGAVSLVTGIGMMAAALSVYALRIDNARMRIQLGEGEAYTGSVGVENPTSKEVQVKVYLEDFSYLPPYEGDKEFSPAGASEYSLAGWITVSPQKFSLGPYQEKKVNFSIRPDGPFSHVHYGVLFSETSIWKDKTQKEGIEVRGRLGTLIFVEPAEIDRSLAFEQISPGKNKIKGIVLNNSNAFVNAKGSYFIFGQNNVVGQRGEVRELYLLPGDKTEISIATGSLGEGEYTLVLTFDLELGGAKVKEVDFSLASGGDVSILAIRD